MHSLPPDIQKIIDIISETCREIKAKAYLFSNLSSYLITGKPEYLKEHVINVIICSDLPTNKLHSHLSKSIPINREIETSPKKFYVISGQFYLKIDIESVFNPSNLQNVHHHAKLTVDSAFYDLHTKEFIDPTGEGILHLENSNLIIKPISSPSEWMLNDVFNVAYGIGHHNGIVDADCAKILATKELYSLKHSIDLDIGDSVCELLLLRCPGRSLKFLCELFNDGKSWVFSKLADFLISLDIPINEDATIDSVLNDKNFDRADAYSNLFLSSKQTSETSSEKQYRLSTILRLLYNSPNLNIPIPYIEHITVLNIDPEQEKSIKAMGGGDYECEYGECPECVPSECAQQPGGGKCCCCHKINYIAEAQIRCHKKVVVSCDNTGTKPGPNDDPFPDNCLFCSEACDMALERNGKMCEDLWGGGGSPPPSWWTLPPGVSPCECSCREGFWSGGCEGCGECLLTCVTCNLFCLSEVSEESGNCSYRLKLTPGASCCGDEPIVDIMFCLDISDNMASEIDEVKNNINNLVTKISNLGSTLRVGLIYFGQKERDGSPYLELDLTSNISTFTSRLNNLPDPGNVEPDIWAAHIAATQASFGDGFSLILVIGNETSQIPPASPTLLQTINACLLSGIQVTSISGVSAPARDALANATGGQLFSIHDSFDNTINQLSITVLPTSCDCLDATPIYVKNANTGSIDIPIQKCVKDDLSDCDCSLPFPLDVCGNIIIVEPEKLNLVCCHTVGCDCAEECAPAGCCGSPDFGIKCPGIDVCSWPSVEAAIDGVWCHCFSDPENIVMNPGVCTDCCCPKTSGPDCQCEECCQCCIKVPDGNCGFREICRSQIEQAVRQAWTACGTPPVPPPDWKCDNANCDRIDECIVGTPTGPLSEARCEDAYLGCISIRNPSVTILNNGVGLVAYESMDDVSVIKIQQFHTSAISKLLPNREFNHGRLQHSSKWQGSLQIAKLYYYDEELPVHFLTGITEGGGPETWKDAIGFRTGPLQNQCFPLYAANGELPYGDDSIGSFVQFIVQGATLSHDFPSGDDVYNIKWFIYNREDEGVIGGIPFSNSIPGGEFLIKSRDVVDEALLLSPHIYNGAKVSIAFPSLASTPNYMNHLENSHFVYLVYQALEDGKWNVYLRQLRLSEYEKEQQIEKSSLISVSDLSITESLYRIICTNDSCRQFDDKFLLTRSVTMEVVLEDGREVYNTGFTGNWTNLCPAKSESEFPKKKVFAALTHSVVSDRCPDQFEFDSIFRNWQVSDEFPVPLVPLTPEDLFNSLKTIGDVSVELGEFDPVKVIGNIKIFSSRVGTVWYDPIDASDWSVLDSGALKEISKYKGLDIDQPILLTENDTGHATHPVVRVNYNNDVFVVYESTESNIQQIQLVGTDTPSSSLPVGVLEPRKIDKTLDYFYKPDDFVYRNAITQSNHRINQLPDMFIDLNDVIHLTWQSNRDNRWEVYYASSDQDFAHKRITNYFGRSLKPRIDGDEKGRLYIVWHDDRFGNWEILMSYFDGSRIIPLSQQDPYLASIRNVSFGWNHTIGLIPLNLTNVLTVSKCFTDITVLFYEDRLLTQLAFKVAYSAWPFAFILKNAQDDTTTKTFTNFADWGAEIDDTNLSSEVIWTITSPEFDTSLISATVISITPDIIADPQGYITIAFRSSDTANDPNADAQWTVYAVISVSTKISYADLVPFIEHEYQSLQVADLDDGTYNTSTLSWNVSGSFITIGLARSGYIRFPIDIPSGSTITSASMSVVITKPNVAPPCNVKITLMDIADARSAWTELDDPADIPNTSIYVEWNDIEEIIGKRINTPSITALVQAFIGRSDYIPGNYIGINFVDNGSTSRKQIQGLETVREGDETVLNIEYTFEQSALQESQGRYKQIRLKYIDIQTAEIDSPLSSIIIESGVPSRLCIPANATHQAFLDLTPEIRIDKLGEETVESPIPIGFLRNNTYFIAVTATDESGSIITFPDQKQSVSCESCTGQKSTWDPVSCSITISVANTGTESRFYNARVRIFTDFDKTNQIMQFDAFPNGNLDCFTVRDNQNAELFWTERGLRVPSGTSFNASLWPFLSNTSGLLCGIKYWVEISTCFVEESSDNVVCDPSTLVITSFDTWVCNCQSLRWDPKFETSPVAIRDLVRWNSSGDGFTDTRLTETIGVSNLNPIIKMRSNLDGLVLYETNRNSNDGNIYNVYASVFSIFPAYNMYATGAESIVSPFNQIIVKSDIPIYLDGGLPDSTTIIAGRNVAFDVDQYDNIFLASEAMLDQSKCQEFSTNKQQIIKVHRCGINASNLFFGHEQEEVDKGVCKSEQLLQTFDPIIDDDIYKSIIKMVRVKNDFVRYHITRNNKPVAVVDVCAVILQVVATRETIAIRARNENSSNWSVWQPFDPELGEYTMEIPWQLSHGNGVKTIEVQASTYQGLSSTFFATIIADYAQVGFSVVFYKLPQNSEIKPPDEVDIKNEELFNSVNELLQLDGIPVAAMRTPTFGDGQLQFRSNDYILIEIIPASNYLQKFSAEEKESGTSNLTFDFIQQGGDDSFGVSAKYVAVIQNDIIIKEVYRGFIVIKENNLGSSKDGLAFIIPHFKDDCTDRSSEISALSFIKDKYNLVVQRNTTIQSAGDVWKSERDNAGSIKHKITIRPLEDPYLIFGDPNYRLKDDKS